ncbi:FkbM family methyltransferase [Synechococcus sp. UW179A]|uniref:FkbM family methyltransferase n=1 Tax=Synechococcus sp. UW179A TaxID=2575510 RepID=UPI001482B6D3|nr:FkbM family methyltransferase [Synechococcus sp. UW179A]
MSLIDIGANIGIYSLAFASKSNSPVYAFEFDPSSQVSLIKNLSLNNFKNITPVLAALDSSKNFSLLPTFYQIFEAGAGAGGLNKIYASVKSSNECLQTLTPSLSLDVFNSIHPFPGESVLKIDTDGHELDILLGSKDLLRSGKILAIILEINSFAYSEADVTDLLTTFGYCLVARSKWCQQLSEGSIYNCVFLKSDSSNDVIDYFKNNCHFEI